MCLAAPGKIIERFDDRGLPMGRVDFDGTTITACLVYVPEAIEGQYVIVHAGFALNVIDEDEAQKRSTSGNSERRTKPAKAGRISSETGRRIPRPRTGASSA
jgi:hydrogenase expression/formation protein HypC